MLTLIDGFITYGNISPEGSNVYLSWPPWVILVAAMSEFMKIHASGLGLHASTAMGSSYTLPRSFVTDMKLIYIIIYVIFRNFEHNCIGFVTATMVTIAVEACNPNPGA